MSFDAELFLWLNFDGGYWSDQLFSGISSRFFAIPLYLILLWQLWKRFGKKTGILLLAVALLIAVSDQTSVFVKITYNGFALAIPKRCNPKFIWWMGNVAVRMGTTPRMPRIPLPWPSFVPVC